MSKLSRNALKEVVKECLIEILEEGLSSTVTQPSRLSEVSNSRGKSSARAARRMVEDSPPPRRRGLDSISYGSSQKSNPDMSENASRHAQNLTSDPVLSSILADTAMTTLQEQVMSDVKGPAGTAMPSAAAAGDRATKQMFHSDPSEIFGDASSKWADLAFSDPINKG
tara:strand:+ start:217 stop:720 length:504 start_codon:yes stop_codon:yes gene_type:complete